MDQKKKQTKNQKERRQKRVEHSPKDKQFRPDKAGVNFRNKSH